MVASVVADAGFLVALLNRRDSHHRWAAAQARELRPPWITCEAVLSEAFFLLGAPGVSVLRAMLQRRSLRLAFDLSAHLSPVLRLTEKYASVPMSLADACLVRMTETHADSLILTTDADFRVYRRHSRQVLPCRMPD